MSTWLLVHQRYVVIFKSKASLVDVNLRLFDLVYLYLLGAMLNFLAANMPGLNNETYFERFSFHILLLNASKDIYYTF